jgi:hypothetical protein
LSNNKISRFGELRQQSNTVSPPCFREPFPTRDRLGGTGEEVAAPKKLRRYRLLVRKLNKDKLPELSTKFK